MVAVIRHPGRTTELEADGPMIISGCVVEPSAISADRDQFTLELEPGARMHVSLFVREGELPPVLRYGQRVEFDARVRRSHNFNNPAAFDYVHYLSYLARQNIDWTASGRHSQPAGRLRLTIPGRDFSAPHRCALQARISLRRQSLRHWHDAGGADRRDVKTRQSVDRGVPLHGHLPRAGDFGRPCGGTRRFFPVSAAPVLRPQRSRAVSDRARELAVCAGDGMAGAGGALGRRLHAVYDRTIFIARPA